MKCVFDYNFSYYNHLSIDFWVGLAFSVSVKVLQLFSSELYPLYLVIELHRFTLNFIGGILCFLIL